MKKVKVAINGFGRIGRQVAKIIMDDKSGLLDLVAINDLYDSKMNAHLFKYDSSYGKCSCEVVVDENDDLIVDGHWIDVLQERDPSNLPWKDLGVDLVIESTAHQSWCKESHHHRASQRRRYHHRDGCER